MLHNALGEVKMYYSEIDGADNFKLACVSYTRYSKHTSRTRSIFSK